MGSPFNSTQDLLKILQDELIGHPENPHTLSRDPLIAASVMIPGQIIPVSAPVEFDSQSRSRAEEVEDVRSERMLTTELQSAELFSAKGAPEFDLRAGHMTAEVSRLRQG